jgi:hypothetical protein
LSGSRLCLFHAMTSTEMDYGWKLDDWLALLIA